MSPARTIETIADRLGATVIAQVPDTGGGAFGAARLARIIASVPSDMPVSDPSDQQSKK